ncbi:hypothetical protein HCG51_06255 [Tolypothrix sp. PCC 7910]|uniref:hypothetical protein n=1 Tax=Tolypothrix sp. PCC 7910 TaxID=2099387 RepID=UPI00142776E9|nr:hypothetical protein [Tolypothrix sp. PCC 7910]QIR36399.1 hypothetical protein HCG51_06255 [Tolypothrix sp. PCC 7910]
MLEYPSISKSQPQFPAYLNFQTLRDIGIQHLQSFSGKLWTDYNLHDPGVTILEVLCYAVTDLGYRNNLDIQDLLAKENPQSKENNFFTVDEILTCNPVTELDLCKRLIDIPGVRNAMLEKVTSYEPDIYVDFATSTLQYIPPGAQTKDTAFRLNPRGLYTVNIDLEPEYSKNACGQLYRSWADVLDNVNSVLCKYRNLCEDIYDVVILSEEEIALCTDIELAANADAEDVLVDIYVQIQSFLSPNLRFYTLQELLEKGKSPTEIFAGRPSVLHDPSYTEPYGSHGFIDTEELAALTPPKILHTSDLYQEILKVPGVAAIGKLSIISYINGLPQSQHPWYLQLTEKHRPVLGVKYSKVRLFKGNLPIEVNMAEVQRRYYEQQAARIKAIRDKNELDLIVPQGSYYDLADHYSIQHDFPLTYGISEDGLPDTATTLRKAQARQLKGYLVFFDQILANYLVQLSHIRDLFSWEIDAQEPEKDYATRKADRQYTYFAQRLQNFPGWEEILGTEDYLPAIGEDVDNSTRETYRDRRNRFLDHLLGRFAESFTDYVLLNYRIFETHADKVKHQTEIMQDKARFLQDYPTLSRDRFRAFNYCNCQEVWDTNNVSGFKKRVSRLLGIADVRRRDFSHYRVKQAPESYILAVNFGLENPTLKTRQSYPSPAVAEAAKEEFLSFALHNQFYQRLSYSYFYHYGWQVVDKTGKKVLVKYDRYFPSAVESQTNLKILLGELAVRLPGLPRETPANTQSANSFADFISIEFDGDLYEFRLIIPPVASASGEIITFTGVERYVSRSIAQENAIASLQQIRQQRNYCQSRLGDDNPKKFTYYGYALVDNTGKVLSERNQRWLNPEERDLDLQSWISSIQANQNQFKLAVEPIDKNYRFVLQNFTNNEILLQSLNTYPTANAAWQATEAFAESLRYFRRYVSPASQSHGLGIKDKDGNLIAVADTPQTPGEIFQQLNSVESMLRIELLPESTSEYRWQLLHGGEILLQSIPVFADEKTARDRFYFDVLGNLFEPGAIYLTTSKEGFGFRILSQPGNRKTEVAIHPHTYTSEPEQDVAINRLFFLIRTARLICTPEKQQVASIGEIYGDNQQIILQTAQRYQTEADAWQQGNTLVELAQDEENYRLIDSENGVYGWELTNEGKDQILASQYYSNKDERTRAIATLQARNNDEGFHVLEHILLRPRTKADAPVLDKFLPILVTPDDAKTQEGEQPRLTWQDPYSFWVTIVLPYWPQRFRNINFRRFIEQTLRLEAPAHVALKIAWLDVHQMRNFEDAYHQWLEQLALDACDDAACDLTGALNRLVKILPKLRSVYPKGILLDSQESGNQENPIVLNQTALGIAIGNG